MENGAEGPVWARFDWSRERYEDFIRLVVPDYREQEPLIARLLRESLPPDGAGQPRILELGVGTGMLSHFLLETLPQAELIALDVSPVMLQASEERLAGFAGRVQLRLADLGTADLGYGYHAAVSRLAIHHLKDEHKRALFSRLVGALLPRGVFVLSDLVAGSNPEETEAMLAEWRSYMWGQGEDPGAWEGLLAGEDDLPSTAQNQTAWLLEAGFADARVVWHRANFAVLCATKSA